LCRVDYLVIKYIVSHIASRDGKAKISIAHNNLSTEVKPPPRRHMAVGCARSILLYTYILYIIQTNDHVLYNNIYLRYIIRYVCVLYYYYYYYIHVIKSRGHRHRLLGALLRKHIICVWCGVYAVYFRIQV